MNIQVFEKWLSKFHLGWIPIAILKGKQIFKITDYRGKCRYFFVMADSRKEVMEWIIDSANNFFRENNSRQEDIIKWFNCKNGNRGKVFEPFEIVRLLEDDLPRRPFPVYNTINKLSFLTFFQKNLTQRKSNNYEIKKIVRFSDSISYSPDISQLKNNWSWNFHEAVFQTGIFLEEFDRMYLLRFLFRLEKFEKKILGWKINLIRDTRSSEDLENPFWNICLKEENALENFLQSTYFFSEKISQNVNTPDMERRRRYDFQKKCKLLM